MPPEVEYVEAISSQPVLASCALDAEDSIVDGLSRGFDTVGYDLRVKEPPLIEFIDPSAVDRLRESGSDFCLVTSIWQHPVRIRPDLVAVHQSIDGPANGW